VCFDASQGEHSGIPKKTRNDRFGRLADANDECPLWVESGHYGFNELNIAQKSGGRQLTDRCGKLPG
jgi:hypothetical protein